jgi:hypothetical protein
MEYIVVGCISALYGITGVAVAVEAKDICLDLFRFIRY